MTQSSILFRDMNGVIMQGRKAICDLNSALMIADGRDLEVGWKVHSGISIGNAPSKHQPYGILTGPDAQQAMHATVYLRKQGFLELSRNPAYCAEQRSLRVSLGLR